MFPRLSHKQFFIINLLMAGPKWNVEIRDKMCEEGWKVCKPTLYRMMGRLIEDGYVFSEYATNHESSSRVTQNIFTVTGIGALAHWETVDFYKRGFKYTNVDNCLDGGSPDTPQSGRNDGVGVSSAVDHIPHY